MATGGASRVILQRARQNRTRVPVVGQVVAAFAGVATMGPIGIANVDGESPLTSWAEYVQTYGGFSSNAQDLPLAVRSFFDEGGQQCFVSRVVHCTTPGDITTKASAQAEVAILTEDLAATSGSITANVGPYNLPTGVTLIGSVNGGGTSTATITHGPAVIQNDAADPPYALSNGQTIIMSINGVSHTKTFATSEFASIGAATTTEVIAALNAYFATNNIDAYAIAAGVVFEIRTTLSGTSATIDVTGGTANTQLAFVPGEQAGYGNVEDGSAITVAEIKTIVEAAISGLTVTNVGGAAKFSSNTTGTGSSIQFTGASTADTLMGLNNAVHTGTAGGEETVLTVRGKWDGVYAHDYSIVIAAATGGDADRFDLKVLKNGVLTESYINLSTDPDDALYVETVVNTGVAGQRASTLIAVEVETTTLEAPDNRPAEATYGPLAGGNDGLGSIADGDFTGTKISTSATGLRCFDSVGRIDEIAIPGRATASVHNGIITYCEVYREGKTFAVLGAPVGYTAAQVRTYVTSTALLKGLTEVGRFVWPRIYVANPDTAVFGTASTILSPVEGAVVGIHARVSASKIGGAFEQPSVANGQIRTALGIETREGEDKGIRGLLHDDNICVVRAERGKPIYLDGSDTLNTEGVFPTVGESRGVMAVMNDMTAAFDDLRQQNINDGLYERMTSAAENYLRRLTEQGAFRTKVREEAYFVDFGKGLNTDDVVDAGYVIGNVGLNTSPAAKFIVITISPLSQLVTEFEAA